VPCGAYECHVHHTRSVSSARLTIVVCLLTASASRHVSLLSALHTILRDRQCPPDEFVYQCDRLGRLVVEYGLAHLPFAPAIVTTPTGLPFAGAAFAAGGADLCGVSIVRGGEAMEIALREVVRDVRIGKIVIQQSAEKMNGPRLYYSKLPPDVAQRRVLLMDPVLGTAQTAKMAVRVLLDHGVPEDRIVFLALIVSAAGARSLAQTFPRVQLITSAVDSQAARGDSQFAVPGLGCFGERYYHQERTAAGSHDDAADAATSSA
jgi:uracil phosphoribosyltransferase